MGEQTILCGILQTGSILSFNKMIEEGVDANYAAKLIQFGWETITEALKYGGITNMMDRLSNPGKIKAFELSEQLKEILAPLFKKHMDDIMSGEKLLEHPGWKPFVEEYSQRVASYRDKGFKLLPLIPKQSRYSPAAMMAFYSSILRRIVKTGGDVFTERVKLSKAEKLTLAAGVYLRHRFFSF